jgi:mRNA interferase RelE/StbE
LAWTIDYTETARRQLKDRAVARRILNFMDERVIKRQQEDPRILGKALVGPLGTLWRYRVGDFRVMCDIQYPQSQQKSGRVLVLQIAHRREVYR